LKDTAGLEPGPRCRGGAAWSKAGSSPEGLAIATEYTILSNLLCLCLYTQSRIISIIRIGLFHY
jgi:hypothetical protein